MSGGIPKVVRREYQPYVKAALEHGGSVEQHGGHLKVFDENGHYVVSLSVGRKGGCDTRKVAKAWRVRGWL